MLAKVRSGAVVGLDGAVVEVEVDISSGLPAFTIVGLPDAAVQESRERVCAAIRNSGLNFPMKRIVVNLAPADLKKAGPAYDLPMVALAHEERISTVIVPESDAKEAGLVEGMKIIPIASLAQLVSYLRGETSKPEYVPEISLVDSSPAFTATDLSDIKGQEHVKRALEVAAAGGHNMIIFETPTTTSNYSYGWL